MAHRDDYIRVEHSTRGSFGSSFGGAAGCIFGIVFALGVLGVGSIFLCAGGCGGCALLTTRVSDTIEKQEQERKRLEREQERKLLITTKSTDPTRIDPDRTLPPSNREDPKPPSDWPFPPASPEETKPSKPDTKYKPSLPTTTLKPGPNGLLLAADVPTYDEYEALKTKSTKDAAVFVAEGKVIILKESLRVEQLNTVRGFDYVRIAEGPHAGKVFVYRNVKK